MAEAKRGKANVPKGPSNDPLSTMTVEEAAARMNVSAQLLRSEIRAGKLHIRRMGRLIRLTEEDVLEYLKSCRQRGD